MLTPSKKGQYALRAIYELAKQSSRGPVKVSDIAEAQGIPRRFLEVILHQLKGSGLVSAKRGLNGGYALTRPPESVSVGDVLRYLQKDADPARCLACVSRKACQFKEQCAFSSLWLRVKDAVFNIYDETTMQDLIDSNEPACVPEQPAVG